MRRFFRVASVAAALGAVAWWLRERMVPEPTAPQQPAPTFRTSPPPSAAEEAGTPAKEATGSRGTTSAEQDLTRIKGIGPVYANKLSAIGITTFADLATADVSRIAEALDISPSRVEAWVEQAEALVG